MHVVNIAILVPYIHFYSKPGLTLCIAGGRYIGIHIYRLASTAFLKIMFIATWPKANRIALWAKRIIH